MNEFLLISTFQLEIDGGEAGEAGESVRQASGVPNKALFLEKVRQSNTACQAGNFELAVDLYTEAIGLEPNNHILYSNRSAAFIKLSQFNKALQDANKAQEIKPTWPKVSVMVSFYLKRIELIGEAKIFVLKLSRC